MLNNEKYIGNERLLGSVKGDFEFYDERCHYRQDTVVDIYIPVKRHNDRISGRKGDKGC